MKSILSPTVRMGVIAAAGLGLWMWAGASSAACLQKVGATLGKVSTYVFMLAPESAVAGYVALGFSRVDCPSDLSVVRSYVSMICNGNTANSIAALNGELSIEGLPRAQTCKDAKAGLAEATGKVN